jgi:hypothetical protein
MVALGRSAAGWGPSGPESSKLFQNTASMSVFTGRNRFQIVITMGTDAKRGIHIIEQEWTLETSLESCFANVGISLLCDWDVFAFLHRHVTSLTRGDQIARLVGYESDVVGEALDRLEYQKLIGSSRTSSGVRLYRVLAPKDVERRGYLNKLVTLSESRAGRLELTKRLRRRSS